MTQNGMYKKFTLAAKRRENHRTQTLEFDRPLPGALPGQFIMAWLPGIGEKPFSLADNDPLSVTVASVGDFSKALCDLSVKEKVFARGPFGQGFELFGKRHLFVGGGYGAAPLRLLASQAIERGDAVQVCLGARSACDLLLVETFQSMGCQIAITTEDGSQGQAGLVTDILADIQASFGATALYACGPTPMLTALIGWCRQTGLSAQLSWEAHMRCGIGLCGSCELDAETRITAGLPAGWLTCRDGPVSTHHFK